MANSFYKNRLKAGNIIALIGLRYLVGPFVLFLFFTCERKSFIFHIALDYNEITKQIVFVRL